MSKKLAIVLTVVLLALIAWVLLFESNSFSILVNGQPVAGPLKGAIGAAGLVAALIACFCAAIILLFVFAGIGIFVLGFVVFFGMIAVWIEFPFLLPLLIPLAILWLFIAIARKASAPP
ncbi:MAG: hypothetical protein WBX11_18870 [Thiobacillaceae bacterium]